MEGRKGGERIGIREQTYTGDDILPRILPVAGIPHALLWHDACGHAWRRMTRAWRSQRLVARSCCVSTPLRRHGISVPALRHRAAAASSAGVSAPRASGMKIRPRKRKELKNWWRRHGAMPRYAACCCADKPITHWYVPTDGTATCHYAWRTWRQTLRRRRTRRLGPAWQHAACRAWTPPHLPPTARRCSGAVNCPPPELPP